MANNKPANYDAGKAMRTGVTSATPNRRSSPNFRMTAISPFFTNSCTIPALFGKTMTTWGQGKESTATLATRDPISHSDIFDVAKIIAMLTVVAGPGIRLFAKGANQCAGRTK